MRSGKQIIDGIYKLCYNIRIVCGANGKVAFLSSKAKPRIRAHLAPFLHVSGFGHLRLINSLALAFESTQSATLLLGLEGSIFIL